MVPVEVSFDLTASPRDVWADTTSGFLTSSEECRNLLLGTPHSLCQHSDSIHCTEDSPAGDIPLPWFFWGCQWGWLVMQPVVVLKPWKQSLAFFTSLCFQDGHACDDFVAVEREDLGCCPRKSFFVSL